LAAQVADGARVPRIRAAGLLENDGSVLFVVHEKDDKRYHLLPGGGVEHGESLAETVAREFHEECGIDVIVEEPLLLSDSIAPDLHRHVVNVVFKVKTAAGDPDAIAWPDHGDPDDPRVVGHEWVPIDELESLDLRPPVAAELRRILRAQGPVCARYVGSPWTPGRGAG
jgi:ADP-ribose pyrophosphatase YjhB (NUDIX family)